jgi:hypothetical protein
MPPIGISRGSPESFGSPWAPALTALTAIFGLMGTTITVALNHGYDLPTAVYAAAVVGTFATTLTIWVLSWTTPNTPGRGPWPPIRA